MKAKGTAWPCRHCRRPHDPWDHISRASNKSLDHHSSSNGREALDAAILPMPTLPHLRRDHEARGCERVHRQLAFLESLRRLPSLDFPIIPLMVRLTFLTFHHVSIELMLGSVPSSLVLRPLTTLCCLLRRPPAFAPLSQTFEPPRDFGSSDCRFPTTHYYAAGW